MVERFGCGTDGFESWVLDFGFEVLGFGFCFFWVSDFVCSVLGFEYWVWVLEFGDWISV